MFAVKLKAVPVPVYTTPEQPVGRKLGIFFYLHNNVNQRNLTKSVLNIR